MSAGTVGQDTANMTKTMGFPAQRRAAYRASEIAAGRLSSAPNPVQNPVQERHYA